MTRIVILANSWQPNGRCLAGIDLDTGEWVRPVIENVKGHFIPIHKCTMLSIGDILKCDLTQPENILEFQRENRVIRSKVWQVSDHFEVNDLDKFVEDTHPILHSTGATVDIPTLESKQPHEWKSLQLVKPRNMLLRPSDFGSGRWIADFQDSADNRYLLSITDPLTTSYLESGNKVSKRCLFTISMATPHKSKHTPDKPKSCYKVVAAVID